MCNPFGGGGGSETQTVVNRNINQVPPRMEQAGEDVYRRAEPLSARDYPTYDEPRIAPFSEDTTRSFDLVRDASGLWKPDFEAAGAQIGQGSGPIHYGAGQGSASGIGEPGTVESYMNPYTQNVVDATRDYITREYDRDLVAKHAAMAKSGSYGNVDRRDVVGQRNREAKNRTLAEVVAKLNLQGFQGALGQANVEKGRNLQAAQLYSGQASQQPQLTYQDIGALAGVGSEITGQEQADIDLRYQDFLNQFYYPQEQANWINSIIGGAPYTTSQSQQQQQIIPRGNQFAQNLGMIGAVAGAGNRFGLWGPGT